MYRTRTAPGASRVGAGRGMGRQPVERPEERGERLAAAGRGMDERVLAARDGRPAAAWASVGASKLARNQSRTAGENGRERVGDDDGATTGHGV